MRALSLLLPLGGSAVLLSTLVGGCNAVSDDCETTASCSDGTSGSSSTSGKSGASGSSGSSGTAGSEGESGAPGGGADQGGASGKGGANSGGLNNSGGDGGASGAGGSSTTPCDTSKSPREEGCIVSDEFAVFVAPTGKDTNAGTQGAPYATLSKAVSAAGDLPILVCDATYDEHVSVTKGARVFGGFKCSNWAVEASKPLFKPTTAGPALKIDSVATAVMLDGVSFEVGDAMAAGETALAAIVNASPSVTLRNVSLRAGKGKTGANGTLTPFEFPLRTDLKGNSAVDTTGGAPKPVTCPGGAKTSGGIGGTASPGGQSGGPGTPQSGSPGGEGGTPGSDCVAGVGRNGANAADAPAASGAQTSGKLGALGWSASPGGDGQNGSPGQGGGGGASTEDGGGGGGGAGACGGAGAKGGLGGGGSIALAVIGSGITLNASELITADAGNGGAGVAGQSSDRNNHLGGVNGNGTPPACPGGVGGTGGNGGASGGGAGGISAGIVWSGAIAPAVSVDTTITNGKAGAKGLGGVPGTNDGSTGVSQKVLPIN